MSEKKESGGFGSGFAVGTWVACVCFMFLFLMAFDIFDMRHEVGADSGVCMVIRDDDSAQIRACASGAEIIDWLREREQKAAR